MSKMQLAVEITFDQKKGGAEASIRSVKLIGDAARDASKGADSLAASFGKVAAAVGLASLAWKGFDALKSMVTQGIEFNATLENSRLGMGALIASMTNITSATRGALEGQEKLNAGMELAGGIMDDIRVMALKTGAVFEDMLQATGTAMGPLLGAKLDIGKGEIQNFVLAVTQMATAVDDRLLKNGQLNQEMRGIIEGDTSKNSRLAQIIYAGMPNAAKTVEDLKAQGKWLDFVMGKMKTYGLAGEMFGKTFSGALSNLKDAFDQALGEGTQGQFGAITELMLDLTKSIVTFDDKGKATFNAQFVSDVSAVTEAFLNLGKGLIALAPVAATIARVFVGTVNLIGGAVAGILEAAFDAVTKTMTLASNTMNGLASQIQAHPVLAGILFGGGAKSVSAEMRGMAGYLGLGAANGGVGAEMFGGMKRDYFDAVTNAWNGPQGASTLVSRTGTDLTASSIPGASPADKEAMVAAKKHAAEILRDRKQELGVLEKITAAMQQSVSTGLLKLNVIRATTDSARQLAEYTLKTKELELKERAAYAEVAGMDQVGLIEKLTAYHALAKTFAQERAEIDTQYAVDKKATDAKNLADWIDNAKKGGAEIAENWAAQTEKELADAELWQNILGAARKPFEDFYGSVGSGLKRAMTTVLDGGGLRSAFDGFFQSIFDTVGENFATLIDGWMEKLSLAASGQVRTQTGTDPKTGQPIFEYSKRPGGASTGAMYGMAGLQGAAALYGLYTNPAPKQGMNIASGAMAGASIGTMINPGIGTVVGLIVGAIAGAFAPTEKGKNVRITGKGGGFSITGMESDWGAAKLRQSINQAIRNTAASLDAIFLGLPTGALEAMANWRPDLSMMDVTGKGDGKNWNEELDNYLKDTLPKKVFDAYGGSITTALRFAGATDQRITELTDFLSTMKTEEAIKALGDYVSVLYGFREIMDLFGGQPNQSGRRRAAGKGGVILDAGQRFSKGVYERADEGPLAGYDRMNDRLAVLSQGFDDLTHEEQVTRGQQILDLSREFFGGIEQYLLNLRDQQRALNESLDAQSREITLDQMTDPKQKVEFLLAEQRKYRDQLMKATTADETNRIAGLMQQNIGSLYDLLGKTPEAAKQMQDQISDIRRIADERYKTFADNAEKMVRQGYDLVKDILTKLQEGLTEIVTVPGGGGAGGGDDDGPTGPRNRDGAYEEVIRFGAAATIGAAGLDEKFTPSIAEASANVLQFSTALASAAITPPTVNVVVQIGAPQVAVSLSGTAEPLISSVKAEAIAGAVQEIMTTFGRSSSRAVVTGR